MIPKMKCPISAMIIAALMSVSAVYADVAKDNSFDFLVFAQIWPVTDCAEWMERRSGNTCNLPSSNDWTVHGVWPTRPGEKGPLFCDKTKKFDFSTLKPILDKLESHWTNVHANSPKDGFWKHEWEKHGTCAMQLPQMDSELKFFEEGVALNGRFPLQKYLSDADITPGYLYDYEGISSAVEKGLGGIKPAVKCDYDHMLKASVLSQISVCLDKSLEPIGCERAYGGLNQGCPGEGKLIHYLARTRVEFNSTGTKAALGILGIGAVMGLGYFVYVKTSAPQGYQSV